MLATGKCPSAINEGQNTYNFYAKSVDPAQPAHLGAGRSGFTLFAKASIRAKGLCYLEQVGHLNSLYSAENSMDLTS